MNNHRLVNRILAYSLSSSSMKARGRSLARGDGHTPVHGPVTSVAWPSWMRNFSFPASYNGQAAPLSPWCAGSGAEPRRPGSNSPVLDPYASDGRFSFLDSGRSWRT